MIRIIIVMMVALSGFISCFLTTLRDIDSFLNYSMKKKIITDKWPLYFPNDRKNESLHGPTIEEPNKGTYLPAFVLSILTYILGLAYFVVTILGVVFLPEIQAFNMSLYGLVVVVVWGMILLIIAKIYDNKYYKNRAANIEKISQILNNNK